MGEETAGQAERVGGDIERGAADTERLQLALAAGAIIGTWFWDLPNDRFTIDAQFAEAFGIDPALDREALTFDQIVDTVHPDDKPGLVAAIDAVIARGGAYAHQYRVRRADGAYHWIEANGRVEMAADGTAERFAGVLLDVGHQRAMQAERDRAHALAAAIVEAVPGVVYAKDRQGRMLLGNAGTTALIGVPPERYLGRTDAEFLADPEQARRIMATDRRIMMTGVLEQVEEEVSLPDGESAIWLSTKAPLRNAAGEVIGLVGSSLDITARKRIEQEREALNELLEGRVAAAIAEREQIEEVMRQSQKMEAVGQLTGGVAHDFNNLLTIIRSSVDLLRRPDLPDERRRRYLDAVSDTVDRAAKLTRQLLAFARRQALRPETFDACAKLDEVGDMLDTLTGARVDIALDLPGTPCFIHADVSQFETALVNMVVNARDAMDGSGTITLRVAADRPLPPIRGHGGGGGPFVAVSIVDRGEGIPAHHLASIFEPFFTTKGVGKGTGLGLSQVFGFAKQSGGDIDVDSVVGEGSRFTLYLPQVGAPMPQVETVTATAALRGQGSRVLVVEDNVDVGAFSSQILADLGYDADCVTSGESALAALGANGAGYDVVFSDVVMPGMGGLELARTLRERWPALPVILASGYSHVLAEDADHGFPLLHKPYSAEQLSGALRAVLRSGA
ncbi:hybrid sensor histidine kinase/response regulator [Sphingomonas sp. MA1305]|uniref:hybrid sensor histidine kinase/response regulator n=1 Tax=Sphingomonas sp. MA1305 TaxID=2479204 RepID=UPI0018E02C92|nr:PAS domain-containing protein [Sphingomonas sp. MA1305]